MISKKGEPFDATVQFNADKRYVEFLFDRDKVNRQDYSQTQSPELATEPSKVFRGKELDDKQYEKLQAGQTVYVSGLIDRKGKEYQGYITFNTGTGKTDFSFEHPDKLKEKASRRKPIKPRQRSIPKARPMRPPKTSRNR